MELPSLSWRYLSAKVSYEPRRQHLALDGCEFCGTERHPFEFYLALNNVKHRRMKVRSPQTNGFLDRYYGTIQTEFFQVALSFQ